MFSKEFYFDLNLFLIDLIFVIDQFSLLFILITVKEDFFNKIIGDGG